MSRKGLLPPQSLSARMPVGMNGRLHADGCADAMRRLMESPARRQKRAHSLRKAAM
jgi:hypothetical protein